MPFPKYTIESLDGIRTLNPNTFEELTLENLRKKSLGPNSSSEHVDKSNHLSELLNESTSELVEGKKLPLNDVQASPDRHCNCLHDTIVASLFQLGHLIKASNFIFKELSDECLNVGISVKRLEAKVSRLAERVRRLDAKDVIVPVGDLGAFVQITDHHTVNYGCDSSWFLPANRPACVEAIYSRVELNPVESFRELDHFRDDGLKGSTLFLQSMVTDSLGPTEDSYVARVQRGVVRAEVLRRPRTARIRKPRPHTMHYGAPDPRLDVPIPSSASASALRSVSSDVVEVDTSGKGFTRQSEFNHSLSIPLWKDGEDMGKATSGGRSGEVRGGKRESHDVLQYASQKQMRMLEHWYQQKRPGHTDGAPWSDASQSLPRSHKSKSQDKLERIPISSFTEQTASAKQQEQIYASCASCFSIKARTLARLKKSKSMPSVHKDAPAVGPDDRSSRVSNDPDEPFSFSLPPRDPATTEHLTLQAVKKRLSVAAPAPGRLRRSVSSFLSVENTSLGPARHPNRQSSSGCWSASSASMQQSAESLSRRLSRISGADIGSAYSLSLHLSHLSLDRLEEHELAEVDVEEHVPAPVEPPPPLPFAHKPLRLSNTARGEGDAKGVQYKGGAESWLSSLARPAKDSSTTSSSDYFAALPPPLLKLRCLSALEVNRALLGETGRGYAQPSLPQRTVQQQEEEQEKRVFDIPNLDETPDGSEFSMDGDGYFTSFHLDSGLSKQPSSGDFGLTRAPSDGVLPSPGSDTASSDGSAIYRPKRESMFAPQPALSDVYHPPRVPQRSSSLRLSRSDVNSSLSCLSQLEFDRSFGDLVGLEDYGGGDDAASVRTASSVEARSEISDIAPLGGIRLRRTAMGHITNLSYDTFSEAADALLETQSQAGTFDSSDVSSVVSSVPEWDQESIYQRLKLKTTISAAVIPSMCQITPAASEEDFTAWERGSVSSFDSKGSRYRERYADISTASSRDVDTSVHYASTPVKPGFDARQKEGTPVSVVTPIRSGVPVKPAAASPGPGVINGLTNHSPISASLGSRASSRANTSHGSVSPAKSNLLGDLSFSSASSGVRLEATLARAESTSTLCSDTETEDDSGSLGNYDTLKKKKKKEPVERVNLYPTSAPLVPDPKFSAGGGRDMTSPYGGNYSQGLRNGTPQRGLDSSYSSSQYGGRGDRALNTSLSSRGSLLSLDSVGRSSVSSSSSRYSSSSKPKRGKQTLLTLAPNNNQTKHETAL